MAISSDNFQSYNDRALWCYMHPWFKAQTVWFSFETPEKDVSLEEQPDDCPRIFKSEDCYSICRSQFGPLLGEVARFPVTAEEFLSLHQATILQTIILSVFL